MIIVSDTSPITNLIQIGQLHLLKKSFGIVILPTIVYDELCKLTFQKEILDAQSWIFVQSAKDRNQVLQIGLDPEESEAIVLALELNADFLIIDELDGRLVAEQKGLKIVGLLGCLIRAKTENHIDSVKVLMDELIQKTGFRINPNLYQHILKLAGE
jgi:uncharacterized protein